MAEWQKKTGESALAYFLTIAQANLQATNINLKA